VSDMPSFCLQPLLMSDLNRGFFSSQASRRRDRCSFGELEFQRSTLHPAADANLRVRAAAISLSTPTVQAILLSCEEG
jgi:hypothetical protein